MALKVTSLGSLVKRAENQTALYTTSAILCGDGKDLGNVTMTDIFNGIISASRNVSQMCTFAPPTFQLEARLTPALILVASQWPSPAYICSLWPERAVERYEGPFNKTLANPILVIGNTVRAHSPNYYISGF